ncbi:guanine nucleotide-binding protein G(q) subunit alpha-like [Lucilia sericata]|uniref:guanine nucleotide-binding protein G(q) subunit alpha-like n=1 Tax=Lucilia sericata TaxID=13632 RepID=UPI0018A87751|nr:guanine nucleotide-binding protein G(q) subunit alpha-like [Lucilia sericata]
MNCLCSEEIRAQNLQNKRLERNLQIHKRKYNKQIKLLLLGTKGSGKSTFIRQMRYETHMPYDSTKYVGIIIQNIFYAMQTMIEAMKVFQIPYKTKVNAVKNSYIIQMVQLNNTITFTNVLLTALKELWADAGIQECFMRGHQYGLLDSTKYFFSHLDRIANPHYTPSIQDILRARIPSKGFQEHVFKYKNVEFLIADVGYQSTERKKWIHCFDNVTAIIYMVAISEYDQFSLDSKHGNSLKESIELLNSIMSFQYFQDTALIIVFNKLDIFEEKITYSHLADYFPEYSGSPYDPQEARSFIANIFLRTIPTKRRIQKKEQN